MWKYVSDGEKVMQTYLSGYYLSAGSLLTSVYAGVRSGRVVRFRGDAYTSLLK